MSVYRPGQSVKTSDGTIYKVIAETPCGMILCRRKIGKLALSKRFKREELQAINYQRKAL